MLARTLASLTLLGVAVALSVGQPAPSKTPRVALQVFGDVIGKWNGTGEPKGTRAEVQAGFWTEKMDWAWAFKGQDAWIKVDFQKSKNFTAGELRYVPSKDHFAMTLTTLKKEKLTYVGTMQTRDTTKILTLERDGDKESQRLVFTFLHANRFLYKYEIRGDGRPLYALKWKVGATKDGESFAVGTGKPECVVSGGTATTPVSFMGKTYYVCCSGCRDEFNASPAKYVAEFEARLAKKKKK
ncbi:MAG: hypothetical protein HYX68_26420 [Planctomycetes bacterium]|nr:hypothetical protein [Planctomycetota bacterium]